MPLVKYNKPNLHTVHVAWWETTLDHEGKPKKGPDGKEIVEQRLGDFTLKPGVNYIDDKLWTKAKDGHPEVKKHLASGLFEEVKASKGQAQSLGDFKEADAVKIVEQTVDKSLLEDWKDSDRRPKVVAAILVQLDKIDPARKDKEEGES